MFVRFVFLKLHLQCKWYTRNIDWAPNTRLVALQKSVIINKWKYAELLFRSDTGASRSPVKSGKINTTRSVLANGKRLHPGQTICILYILWHIFEPSGCLYRFPNGVLYCVSIYQLRFLDSLFRYNIYSHYAFRDQLLKHNIWKRGLNETKHYVNYFVCL